MLHMIAFEELRATFRNRSVTIESEDKRILPSQKTAPRRRYIYLAEHHSYKTSEQGSPMLQISPFAAKSELSVATIATHLTGPSMR